MSISVGIYDFFAFTIPGGLYLATIIYLSTALGLVQVKINDFSNLSLIQIVVGVAVAYILGLIVDPVAKQWYRLFKQGHTTESTFVRFKQNYPEFELKFKSTDWPLLRAFVRRQNKDLALDIERMSVLRTMLRNVSFALMLLALIQAVRLFSGNAPTFDLITGIVLATLSVLSGKESVKYSDWFHAGFYEAIVAYAVQASDFVVVKNDLKVDKTERETTISLDEGNEDEPRENNSPA